jgi:hypothetical protein
MSGLYSYGICIGIKKYYIIACNKTTEHNYHFLVISFMGVLNKNSVKYKAT